MKRTNQLRRLFTIGVITFGITFTTATGESVTAAINLKDILNFIEPVAYTLTDNRVSQMKEAVKDFYTLPDTEQQLLNGKK